MNFFKKVWGWLKSIKTRPGFVAFMEENMALARQIVKEFAEVHSGESFDDWKRAAWERLQQRTGEIRGNWISLLLGFAFEEFKAGNDNKGG